jgi:hypothetical protein
MGQNESATSSLDRTWGEFVTRYQPFMDAMIPYLPAAEQGVYHFVISKSSAQVLPLYY